MARRHSDIDKDDSIISGSRRKKQKVNYRETDDEEEDEEELENESDANGNIEAPLENGLDDDEEPTTPGVKDDTTFKDDDEYDEDDDLKPRTRRSRRGQPLKQEPKPEKKVKPKTEDDDESFNESSGEEDESLHSGSDGYQSDFDKRERQRQERSFITKGSDEDDGEDYGYRPGSGKPKRSSRKSQRTSQRSKRTRGKSGSRQRSSKTNDAEDDDDDEFGEDDTVNQELQELKDTDDEGRPGEPRSLRQKKPINYAIPPPLTDNMEGLPVITETASPRRRGGGSNNSAILRLFPTGGPFGGGNVTSLFGKNYAGTAGQPGAGGLLAGGADSDSSDDEIVPVMGGKRSSISAPVGMSMGNDHKKKQNADTDPLGVDMNIDFSAVGGLDNYINQLKEMVALPLLYPEVYQKFGITPPRGVLFHGPPGTGKTLMARALAASCSSEGRNITFFMRKGADVLSKWVGEAERQLRLLFEEARKQQPSIIFFDEIDGLAPVRSSKQEQIHASIVSTLLALMDGMDNRGQVIVIGATNRPDAVDPALRRPGRFDREFYFPLPDISAREQILSIHTKKWDPPLSKEFLSKVAHLTKGYGGADLRALCTEAALNSIQRRYPQIYQSTDKLHIDPDTIKVAARDFMKALEKIVPSSARSTSSGSAPLPDHLTSLLGEPLQGITDRLDKLVPRVKKLSSLEEAQFVDPTEDDEDGGFGKHELLKRLEASRVHRPRLLIAGDSGNGQQYLGAAVLNHLEGFNVQSLDLGQLYGDSTRTAENAIIQSFVEARRHKPSIIFIPNVDIWFDTVPESAKSTLAGLLRSVSSNERILLLGVSDTAFEDLPIDLKLLFGLSVANHVDLSKPTSEGRKVFFEPLFNALIMKPTEFLDNKKKRKLEKLKKVEIPKQIEKVHDLQSFAKEDMRLKNALKIKLSGLMDLFKNRYKRFKKPAIEDQFLVHLFYADADPTVPQRYTREGDMILDTITGRKFYNMDLELVEDRLWNGFYSEPKQFLKDIEMIYKDAVVLDDREKLMKASEMYANAQVGVEELSQPEFIEQCKALRKRELQRQREQEKLAEQLLVIEEATEQPVSTPDPKAHESALITDEPAVVDKDGDVLADTLSQVSPSPVALLDSKRSEIFSDAALHQESPTQATEKGESQLPIEPVVEEVVPEVTQEEESSSDEETVPEPPLVIDNENMRTFAHTLVADTNDFSVDQLEQINARLMEIVWDDRHSWDRTKTVLKLFDEFVEIQSEFYKGDEDSTD